MPTFPHVTKGVFVWFVRAHSTLHVRRVHARLIVGVGRHVLPGKCRIASVREGVLQVNAAPRKEAKGRRISITNVNDS